MTDLILAIAHHLLVFSLAAILATELAMIRPGLDASGVRRLGLVDILFGALATAVVAVGFLRVFYGVKGSCAYLPNPIFWAKMATFGVVGLLSIQPTVRILGWGRQAKAHAAFILGETEALSVRRFVVAEIVLFAFIPMFAAAMARGYGLR